MRLLSEIRSALGAEGGVSRVQYTVSAEGGYFQNVKRILEFSPQAVVFAGRKGSVRVEGENLTLGKYCAGDALVRGAILRVEREGE